MVSVRCRFSSWLKEVDLGDERNLGHKKGIGVVWFPSAFPFSVIHKAREKKQYSKWILHNWKYYEAINKIVTKWLWLWPMQPTICVYVCVWTREREREREGERKRQDIYFWTVEVMFVIQEMKACLTLPVLQIWYLTVSDTWAVCNCASTSEIKPHWVQYLLSPLTTEEELFRFFTGCIIALDSLL